MKPKETDFEPRTLGEHLKRSRLQRKLSQIEAARVLEVDPGTILNWEKGYTEPPVEAMPALLEFVGYDPYPKPKTLPERLTAKRRNMGWSIRQAAGHIGVDPGTWRDWEQGRVILYRGHRAAVAQLLELDVHELDRGMGARWDASHRLGRFSK